MLVSSRRTLLASWRTSHRHAGSAATPRPQPIPVTLLTGFLGSGKTTLLNNLLSQDHGKRLAVIENELGAVAVDNELLLLENHCNNKRDEELFFFAANGCICCTVQDDLSDLLARIFQLHAKQPLDGIVLETTGAARPGPVIKTFMTPSL